MNIYLGEHFETFIREQVATGRYANASEVVREALRQYQDLELHRTSVTERILAGLEDMKAGRVTRVENMHEYMENVRKDARERIAAMEDLEHANAAS